MAVLTHNDPDKGVARRHTMDWFRQNMFWDQIGDQGHTVLDKLTTEDLVILAEKVQSLITRHIKSKGSMDKLPPIKGANRAEHNLLRAELQAIENSYIHEGITPEKQARAQAIIAILKADMVKPPTGPKQ